MTYRVVLLRTIEGGGEFTRKIYIHYNKAYEFMYNFSKDYIHFETVELCESFINQFGWSYITCICCSGKGFGYMNTAENVERIQRIRRRSRQEEPIRDYPIGQISQRSREPIRDYPIVHKENPHHVDIDIDIEKECCVCLTENARYTPCMHNFCLSCEQQWKRVMNTCPICRTALA